MVCKCGKADTTLLLFVVAVMLFMSSILIFPIIGIVVRACVLRSTHSTIIILLM
jgi:hypothetical protein